MRDFLVLVAVVAVAAVAFEGIRSTAIFVSYAYMLMICALSLG